MQSVFSTKDDSGEFSDFEVEVDQDKIMWSKVRGQNKIEESSSWLEISLVSSEEHDDDDEDGQTVAKCQKKKSSEVVDNHCSMNGVQTTNLEGRRDNLFAEDHSDTPKDSEGNCTVIEYNSWLAEATSMTDNGTLGVSYTKKQRNLKKVALKRTRETKAKNRARVRDPVITSKGKRRLKHVVNTKGHIVPSKHKLCKIRSNNSRVSNSRPMRVAKKRKLTSNPKTESSSPHLDMVSEKHLPPKLTTEAGKTNATESPVVTTTNGYNSNISVIEQQDHPQVNAQKTRPTVNRKRRNAWKRGKIYSKVKLVVKKRNCTDDTTSEKARVSELTSVESGPSDALPTSTLEISRITANDDAHSDWNGVVTKSSESPSKDGDVSGSSMDVSLSLKKEFEGSGVVSKNSGQRRRLTRDIKCLMDYTAKNGLVSRRTSRNCNRIIKFEQDKPYQKHKLETLGKSTDCLSSTSNHTQSAPLPKLKRKMEERIQPPIKSVKRKQSSDLVTAVNPAKSEQKIEKQVPKGQDGISEKKKGTKKSLGTQTKNGMTKSKKVPAKVERDIPGSKATAKQKSVKTKGTVRSLVSQKKKAIRMQLALEKKKKNETKRKNILDSNKNNGRIVEMTTTKKVKKNSVPARRGRPPFSVSKSCTVTLHSLKSAGVTVQKNIGHTNEGGTKKQDASVASDLKVSSHKALCVSPGHLQLHRLAAIFPAATSPSINSQKQSVPFSHLAQTKGNLKGGSQLQKKLGLTDTSLSASFKLKGLPHVVLTQLPLSENPTRSSLRQTECAFRYREIAIKKQENFIQIVLMSNTRVKNGLNCQVMYELQMALTAAKTDSKCRVVVINGTGSVFCSGVDLISLSADQGQAMAEKMANAVRDFCKTLLMFPKPLVAAVNGAAVGLGVTFLPYFDLVYASDKATFYTPYGKLGQVPEGGATLTLPSILGYARANGLLLEGRRLTAQEAHDIGLVTQVLWPSLFMEEVIPRVRAMASRPLQAMESTKALVRYHSQSKLEVTLDTECRVLVQQWSSRECRSAIQHFLQHEEVV